jgi:hypothetical protein
MATAKLPEVPPTSALPKPTSNERDAVFVQMEKFAGGYLQSRDDKGIPNLFGNPQMRVVTTDGLHDVYLTNTIERIKKIPQWEKGLAKPEVRAEWDSFFKLLPKWTENVFARLKEKNNTFSADEDASDESREINWMMGRLSKLQTDIDFAAQEAIVSPPGPKFEPPTAPTAQPASPQAAPPQQAPGSSPPPPAESPGADKGGKSSDTNWMLYAAGGVVALVLLAQMNRR